MGSIFGGGNKVVPERGQWCKIGGCARGRAVYPLLVEASYGVLEPSKVEGGLSWPLRSNVVTTSKL